VPITDDLTGEVSVPLARYPGPVCVYELAAGEAVVRHVNDPFETQLAAVDAGTCLVHEIILEECLVLVPHGCPGAVIRVVRPTE